MSPEREARPFVLAVPSKGRLQENAARFFARAGLDLTPGRGARDYRGRLAGFDGVEIAFLPVPEIVAALGEGLVHLGVAGEDLIRETLPDADARVQLLAPLGFGEARVVVAVPQAWIDVRTMADLEDVTALFHARRGRRMRVATKYVATTRRFFAEHGVSEYRIVESLGATEGAPAAGTAELIVDITTTGATLGANALKVLDDGVILRSEANLAASLKAPWTTAHVTTARTLLARIAAEEAARLSRDVTAQMGEHLESLAASALGLFGAQALPAGGRSGQLAFRCAEARAADLAGWLIEQGAAHVAVTGHDYLFAAENPLYEALVRRLEGVDGIAS